MRSRLSELSFLPLAAGLLTVGLTISGLAVPAAADGGPYRDRIYADSFGNLVVHSRSGYKRIVVGQGHLARELADYEGGSPDDVVYLDDDDGEDRLPRLLEAGGAAQGPQLHVRPGGRRVAGPARRMPPGTARGTWRGAQARPALIWSRSCVPLAWGAR